MCRAFPSYLGERALRTACTSFNVCRFAYARGLPVAAQLVDGWKRAAMTFPAQARVR